MSSVAALVVLVAAFGVVIACVLITAGHGRDDFDRVSVSTLTDSLRGHGLTVCSQTTPDTGHGSGGSISTQQIEVSMPGGCGDPAVLQLDAYKDASHRDAAARNAEVHARPRAFGTVYTWHRYTVYLQADDASRDASSRDRIVDALDAVGAQ
jgi:hypothetical protein